MADELVGVPQNVPVRWYSGDTMTLRVNCPAEVSDGKEWLAQIRSSRTAPTADAVFNVILPVAPGDPAFLVLPAAETARLMQGVTKEKRVRREGGVYAMVLQYQGFWDVQVSGVGGTDPVTTLAQGTMTIELDVTRPE